MAKDQRAHAAACDVEAGLVGVRASALRPPSFDPLIGRCLGGKLIVGERLGAGARGVVYRAKHVLLPQPMAVKILHAHCQADADLRARFLAEAQSASTLDHPSLVRVIDFGEERGGVMWLAMELLEGQSLDGLLAEQEEGRLAIERAIEIVLDVCAGLAHAHARGIIHGDVKPSNIVIVSRVDDEGEVAERAKLCDFGVANVGAGTPRRGTFSDDDDAIESGSRRALGTPAYMSPEQCLGEDLDARSDVYACGVLFYELLMGEVPFAGSERQALLRRHLLMANALSSAVRAELDARTHAIVSKTLSKEPSDRFASMRELRAALRELSAGLGLPPRASTLPPLPPLPQLQRAAPTPMQMHDDVPVPEDVSAQEITPVRAKVVSEVRELCTGPHPTSDLADFLQARAELLDREKFALSELLQRGTAEAVAWRVARLVARVESSRGRDTVALEALRLLDTPANLHAFAERLLVEEVLPSPYVTRVLERGGRAFARALWTARISRSGSIKERRTRFVAWMQAVGPTARDVLRAALRKLAPHADTHRHTEVIEDVLLTLPARCDDELLAVTATFAKSPVPRVRELALAAITRALDEGSAASVT